MEDGVKNGRKVKKVNMSEARDRGLALMVSGLNDLMEKYKVKYGHEYKYRENV